MELFGSGDPAGSLGFATWVKSSSSTAEGNCVELAALPGGLVAVRDSKVPEGPVLVYPGAGIVAFVTGAARGEFECLID
ncbi:DUF397 domain-containing protein [Embleya sp. NBC_00896]|uniref:DUF397 domain-containing protein n=1 Tax=Embleya sp. NBC_00896 TaxID=2975961 RepID=UPI002F90ADEB|nr:DUF397 domain-containing protein [Embleya sp. NBC_00896]